MPYLRIDHVSKVFSSSSSRGGGGKGFAVFEDVDLSIAEGEFVTVIGHSGCGKSTLLNIIAGFDQPSSGAIFLANQMITRPGLDRMVVFQNFALMPWLTAFDNVRLAVKQARPNWSRHEIREWTQKYIDMMSLGGAERKWPAFLSGGMRQRVGLARAFAVEPKVLLLDEPFAQIDALTRGAIQEELIRMWSATRSTVFMVTHDVDEAILLSDRIVLMTRGPGARLADTLRVKIPRPRTREALIDSPDYSRLRSQILHFLMNAAKSDEVDADPDAEVPRKSERFSMVG